MPLLHSLIAYLISGMREHAERARRTATVGATTVEYILMALLGITVALLVTAAITAYVNGKIGQLGT